VVEPVPKANATLPPAQVARAVLPVPTASAPLLLIAVALLSVPPAWAVLPLTAIALFPGPPTAKAPLPFTATAIFGAPVELPVGAESAVLPVVWCFVSPLTETVAPWSPGAAHAAGAATTSASRGAPTHAAMKDFFTENHRSLAGRRLFADPSDRR
jgi:hypothetical protein